MTVLLSGVLALFAAGTALLAVRLRRARRDLDRVRRRAEQLEEAAARADEAKRRFLSSITHELRTPLTAILGYQGLLADGMYGETDDRARKPIERIGSAAEHLLQLIDGVLELARLDTGSLELNVGPVSVPDLLARTVDSACDLARDHGVSLDTDIAPRLPLITSDPDRLERALSLALLAAIRASSDTTLHLTARSRDAGGVHVRIDGTGLVLDEYSPERVFGGFQTTPGSTTTGRTGLRLSIALRLVRMLGGDLSLEPAGEQTTLRLHIVDAPLLVGASASGAR